MGSYEFYCLGLRVWASQVASSWQATAKVTSGPVEAICTMNIDSPLVLRMNASQSRWHLPSIAYKAHSPSQSGRAERSATIANHDEGMYSHTTSLHKLISTLTNHQRVQSEARALTRNLGPFLSERRTPEGHTGPRSQGNLEH